MGKYSIKELERLSGIKAHTIRIWEKRYNIIVPERTPTNIRVYSDEDLKKIINVSLLNNHGIKISRIAGMSFKEISVKVQEMSEEKPEAALYIDQLVLSMVDLEEERFEEIVSKLIKKIGFERTITEIVYPFMEKIGVLWQTGTISPAHEHFISNLIRQRLITSIASLPIPSRKAKKAILFLPEDELHELGLLFFHYLARKNGFRTFYLGQSVPHEDLKAVYRVHQPQVLITSLISSPPAGQFEKYIHTLSTDFPNSVILASGLLLRNIAFHIPKNVRPFYKATELTPLLGAI